MRLWGKIKGTSMDYYIAEGTLEASGGDGDEDGGAVATESLEARGSGVNKFVYWVCNSPNSKWVQLPDLKPSDIMNARCIKHTFSGDLNRDIFTNPFYFQKENVYLRAQIARITSSTSLTPAGVYVFQEESTREIEAKVGDEENPVVVPSVNKMTNISHW